MLDTLYYEAHITIPSVSGSEFEIIDRHRFNLSNIDGDGDDDALVLTTREKDYTILKSRMIDLMKEVAWSRYKVESVVVDSKCSDIWSLKV